MKTLKCLATSLLLSALAITPAPAAPTSQQLQQGLYAEEVEGNIAAAIKAYDDIIKDKAAPANLVAQALYRQGMCYLKLKEEPLARAALEKLIAEHADQAELAAKARAALDDLTDFDPALLMPPGTLVYLEFGSPGRQVETVLTTLKGTPFENPLTAIAGAQPTNAGQGPANLVAALLNPSMMAEFKKMRSFAVGVTGIAQNNPPMISVFWPGKSDALRGLIQAALGMAGPPGQPMEGMQTVDIKNFGAVAYDDKIVIVARPATQLSWCVKQYKGLTSEPSLASSNASFKKLGKLQRLNTFMTLWAQVDEGYAQLLKMFPAGQVPPGVFTANALFDFANIEDLTLVESIETNGFSCTFDFQFKDGHHSLAYGAIRTPNITRAALEAVPEEAVGVASFALSPNNPEQAGQVQAKIQSITGLDLGREIFANIEQITLFAMPAAGDKASSATNLFLLNQLGLTLTSRNPEQTRQILSALLGTASAVSANPGGLNPGQFKVGNAGYCYLDQVNGTTLLSMNPDIIHACVTSSQNHKSICAAGPLNGAVNQLGPFSSKFLAINVGGAIRLSEPRLARGAINEDQATQLRDSLAQLAHAADATTIQVRTDEQPNELTLNSAITGLPTLDKVVGPIAQIGRIRKQIGADAIAQKARQEMAAVVMPALQAPAIDGTIGEAWKTAPEYKLENVFYTPPTSSNDLSASYRALWDHDNLYLLVEVTDDVLRHDSPADQWWECDSVEVYIDGDNSKAPAYGPNDYQYAFIWDKTSPQMLESKNNRTNDVQYAIVTTEKGYRVEAKFPWTTLGAKASAGAKIGLDVHVNDNDTGKRKTKISWHAREDNAWSNPQLFGNAELAGLVGWWKCNETQGATVADSSGNHHDGTVAGNATWTKGRTGGAIDLNGHDNFVRIADKSAFDFAGNATVACWVRLRSVPVEWTAIVTKGDTAWRLSTSGSEMKFHFAVQNWEAGKGFVNGATTVRANEWHHLAGVYDGSVLKLYLDGTLDATAPWDQGMGRNNFDVLIGENAENKGRCFDGLIDDVRVYNYALSDNEIKALAAAP
jgi:tetratricopeptide (TPR) repeat protein